jgi:hypothetical protein
MKGVEIITSTQVVTEMTSNTTATWISFGITLFIMLAIGIFWAVKEKSIGFFLICLVVGLFVSGMSGSIAAGITTEPTAYETHYKVIVDESVGLSEFTSYYEILDQEGKIYIVRERVAD